MRLRPRGRYFFPQLTSSLVLLKPVLEENGDLEAWMTPFSCRTARVGRPMSELARPGGFGRWREG